MTIEWRGEGCFEISTTGDHFSILTELPSRDSGLNAPRTKTDVLLGIWAGLEDTIFSKKQEDRFIISGPGEYEVKGVTIKGTKLSSDGHSIKTAYLIGAEDLQIGYLGEISKKEVTPELVGFFEDVDVLMIPIGGGEMLDADAAMALINQIEPKIAIPMYYKISGLKRKADSLEVFLKEAGVSVKPEEKLLIKKKDLNLEETKIFPLMVL
ncbi:MAG TPA: MBL fold metallo-hydrolase [Candidatus Paceibacterota bacterium]|nr:MBL fold metallo-hydrolase [Candidatus Paceibacterota bacterium]HRY77100.1 MBL fold metallo-hydrolase [Candidatus Paceibacterota bacterium]